jgi:hypothetical protein
VRSLRRTLSIALVATLTTLTASSCAAATDPTSDPASRGPAAEARLDTPGPVDSILAISIDGLNPDALRKLRRKGTPSIHAFARAGASTLNARTEYELTVTLPNHTGMVTGRRVDARFGGHGVTWNDDRRRPATVQAAAHEPVASVFSEVSGAGGATALFASKTKFSLWKRSWPEGIDRTTIIEDNDRLVTRLEGDLARNDRAFRFLHLSLPDAVGHDRGFMSRPYLRAVRHVDRLVGRAVAAVESDPELAAHTAIVLTSDHGGRGASHADPTRYANYRVVFMVRGPGVDTGADLYALNPELRDPRRGRPSYDRARQPVRNGMLANLSLDLLGLDAVPGSEHDLAQTLDVTATP